MDWLKEEHKTYSWRQNFFMFNRNYQSVSLIWFRTNKNRFQTNSCMCNESELFITCYTFCHMKSGDYKLNLDDSCEFSSESIGIFHKNKTLNLVLGYNTLSKLGSKKYDWRAKHFVFIWMVQSKKKWILSIFLIDVSIKMEKSFSIDVSFDFRFSLCENDSIKMHKMAW